MIWVSIPSQLLALAGISLASGVFASVISASTDPGKKPDVTAIAFTVTVVGNAPPKGTAAGANWLKISGVDFGDSGTVRLNGAYVKVIYWNDKEIGVDVNSCGSYNRIAVDTPNGKLAYELTGTAATTIRYADWNVSIPQVPFVASVADQARVALDFVATATA